MHPPTGPLTLTDCRRHGPGSGAELFVVEGDSAAGAVARVRAADSQAVLPLRGKPLNALRAPRARVTGHAFFAALARAIELPIGAPCDPGTAAFERLVLLMDPDADGIHCGALVVVFLLRWMRPLLGEGRVVMIRPPWGELSATTDGRRLALAWSEEELRGLSAARPGEVVARRFRGLASLDDALLERSCVARSTRRAETVTPAAAELMAQLLGAPGADGDH
jgi:DNA gyrase subunit B